MSSSYPITKCVRWRMKDWVSCFKACRLPIVDEENETNMEISPPFPPTTSDHQYSIGEEGRRQDSIRQTTIEFACNEGMKVSPVQKGLSKNTSNRSQMSEEEYIVFCFRENGDIHVIEDRKSTASSHQVQSKSVNRKLMYGENKESDPVSINIQVVSGYTEDKNQEMNEDGICFSDDKDKEEGKTDSVIADQRLPNEISETVFSHSVEKGEIESNKPEGSLIESSSGSNLSSEESTTSFSFPVLSDSRRSWEWLGSPVLKTHPEDNVPRLSDSKDNCSRLHYCSF